VPIENAKACAASSRSVGTSRQRSRIRNTYTPLALNPNKAIEIAMNAKW
jgi:hypothetical protein